MCSHSEGCDLAILQGLPDPYYCPPSIVLSVGVEEQDSVITPQ